jgi:hypothetical protein
VLFCKKKNVPGIIEKSQISGLFKNVQMQGAQKANREAYINIR